MDTKIIDSSNSNNNFKILIDKILSEPLSFVPGKHEEFGDKKPSSYILVSNTSSKSKTKEPSGSKDSKLEIETKMSLSLPKPKSMAEAVAAYTGKKYLLKAEKKTRKVKGLATIQVQPEPTEDLGEEMDSTSDEEYQSAVDEPVSPDDEDYESLSDQEADSEVAVEHSPAGRLYGAKLAAEDSDDELNDKRIHEKIELKKSANNDLRAINKELIDRENTADEGSHSSNEDLLKKSRSVLPTRSVTSSDEKDDEFQYGQNLDFTNENFFQIEEDQFDRGSNGSTRILKNWGPQYLDKKPMGLLNHGVTCYTNAAVQAMVHIPAVQHYLMTEKSKSGRSVTKILAGISSRMWKAGGSGGAKYINPKNLIKKLDDINCMMSEWQQEDSHEYFMSLLSRLQEESTPKQQKLNTSIVYDIFGGLLNQSIVCKNCNHISKTQQEFYDLSLSLDPKKKRQISSINNSRMNSKEPSPESQAPTPQSSQAENLLVSSKQGSSSPLAVVKSTPRYSVINAITDFFEPDVIKNDPKDKQSGYNCSHCKKTTDALKFSSVARAPETLVIHIKRFRFNETSNSSSKLKSAVSYPLILDLTDFESGELSNYEKPDNKASVGDKDPIRYQLISVVVHEGRSISSGHYIAHCRQPSGEWCTYDDEYMNTISERQALKDPNAYYLIYTRLKYKSSKRGPQEGDGEDSRDNKRRRKV